MEKKEFQYRLSNIDMKDFYEDMLCCLKECPEVIVFEELEDGSKVLRRQMDNGNHLIYLKKDENMFETLVEELLMEMANVVPAFPFENHGLSDKDTMIWIACACKIAELLNVRCPQIIFTSFEDAGNAAGQGMLCLPDLKPCDFNNIVEMFICIAHELRHEWQYVNHPDWREGYVHVQTDDDMDAYLNHRTEIDAEAYARKFTGIVFGLDLLENDGTKLRKKLINRAKEIDISIKIDSARYILGILGLEE